MEKKLRISDDHLPVLNSSFEVTGMRGSNSKKLKMSDILVSPLINYSPLNIKQMKKELDKNSNSNKQSYRLPKTIIQKSLMVEQPSVTRLHDSYLSNQSEAHLRSINKSQSVRNYNQKKMLKLPALVKKPNNDNSPPGAKGRILSKISNSSDSARSEKYVDRPQIAAIKKQYNLKANLFKSRYSSKNINSPKKVKNNIEISVDYESSGQTQSVFIQNSHEKYRQNQKKVMPKQLKSLNHGELNK